MNPKQAFVSLGLFMAGLVAGALLSLAVNQLSGTPNGQLLNPLTDSTDVERHLDQYSFSSLSSYQPPESPIKLLEVLAEEDKFISYLFSYQSAGQTITGQINLPKDVDFPPVIIMLRGFVPRDIYQTGVGTKNAAAFFAGNGFATVAPDFLSYGGSDSESEDIFVARFIKPLNVLDLIKSVEHYDKVEGQKIGLWGHSNGGQISLSVLEITGRPLPTSLWAPVSKPFPFNILYYTYEYQDFGKGLRSQISQFESSYNASDYSVWENLKLINAPIILHQGGKDEAVPYHWSNQLVKELELVIDKDIAQEFSIEYHQYPQADHNMKPDWNQVVTRDLEFFSTHLLD